MKSDRLRQEFSSLESVEAPELLPEIAQRIELIPVDARPDGPGSRTRMGQVILAFGVLGGVIAGVLVLARVLPTDTADRNLAGAGPIPENAIVLGIIENGLTRLYVIEEDGSGFTGPTANGSPLAIPGYSVNVSPDASRATFVRAGGQERGVWVSRIDGSEAVRLTEATPNGDENPVWSPDGGVIVFSRNRVGHHELFTINADGSNLTQITSNDIGQDAEPAWSPDGSSIVFTRNSGGPIDLWIVGTDGSTERQLTQFEDQSGSPPSDPDWSPDGARIVFAAAPPGADREDVTLPPRDLWAIDADGTNLTRLTDTPEDDINPRWSPDGKAILFQASASRDPAGVDLRGRYSLSLLELPTGRMRSLQAPTGSLFDTAGLQWLRQQGVDTPEPATVTVPDVTGLSREQAVAQLESLGLIIQVAVTAAEDIPEGLVASQDPAPGTSVDAGTNVMIVIGVGPPAPVPTATKESGARTAWDASKRRTGFRARTSRTSFPDPSIAGGSRRPFSRSKTGAT